MGLEISTAGDVYSYGVILLEMITGRRPTDDAFGGGLSLRGLVEAALPAGASPLRPRRRLRSSAIEAAPLAGAPDGGREGLSPAAGGRIRRGGTVRTHGRGRGESDELNA